MKLYYFMIIAIGLMFTFNLAGIDTGSSNIFKALGIGNNNVSNISNVDVYPDLSNESNNVSYEVRDVVNPKDKLGKSYFWYMIAIALAVLVLTSGVTGVKILGFGVQLNLVNSISAGVATFILAMFAYDFFSIVRYMAEITGGTGWEYYLVWILIFPFLATFAFQLIKFIQGTD